MLEIIWCGRILPWTAPSRSNQDITYNLIIIGPRGLQYETNLSEIIGWESSDAFRFDLGPLLQGQTSIAELKSAYNLIIIGPRGLQCETNLSEIMGWESSDAFRFDLGPLR